MAVCRPARTPCGGTAADHLVGNTFHWTALAFAKGRVASHDEFPLLLGAFEHADIVVRVNVNRPLSSTVAVADVGSFAVSSPSFVVDLTATAGMLLFAMKLAVTVTSFAGILMVVVAPSTLPMNSAPSLVVHVFSPWPEGRVAVMLTSSPAANRAEEAVEPLIVPFTTLRAYLPSS